MILAPLRGPSSVGPLSVERELHWRSSPHRVAEELSAPIFTSSFKE